MNDFVAEQKLQMITPESESEQKFIESSKYHRIRRTSLFI